MKIIYVIALVASLSTVLVNISIMCVDVVRNQIKKSYNKTVMHSVKIKKCNGKTTHKLRYVYKHRKK